MNIHCQKNLITNKNKINNLNGVGVFALVLFSLSNKYALDKSIILAHNNALKYICEIN